MIKNLISILVKIKILHCSNKTKWLLANFLSNHGDDKFCLKCFIYFQNEKKHLNFCENSNYLDQVLPKKFKTVLYESTGKKIEVPANILRHTLASKSLYQYVKVVYDFETIIVKLDQAELNLEEIKGKKD